VVEDVPSLDVTKGHVINCFVRVMVEEDDVPKQIVRNQLWVEVLCVVRMVEEGSVRYQIVPNIVKVPPSSVSNMAEEGFVLLRDVPRYIIPR
jgi:hypothetical protein